jgi:hypothetical protein
MNKIGYHRWQPVTLTLSPAIFDRDVLALHIAGLLQPLAECSRHLLVSVRRLDIDEPDYRRIWLLRARNQRPRQSRANENCDEFPSPHGFAHAEDYIGYEKEYHIWIENCAVRYTQAVRCHVRFGSKADIASEIAMSALPPKADIAERDRDVRFVPILLQKSFCIVDHKISEPWARFSCKDVRGHMISR